MSLDRCLDWDWLWICWLLAHLQKPHMSRNCWTTSFFKVQCTKVLHETAHLWFGWFGLQSKHCWLAKVFCRTKLQASQLVSTFAVRSAALCTPQQWLRTMRSCSLLKLIDINMHLMRPNDEVRPKHHQRHHLVESMRALKTYTHCEVHATLICMGWKFFASLNLWRGLSSCFLVSHVFSTNFQDSKHKCFKSFLGQHLAGLIKGDKVWHASLLVRMWEVQCESLRCHSLVPCRLFEKPRRIRCSKNTVYVGSVCYVIHAKTWCLVTTLFEKVGKVGFQAAVLRLKATNHFSSVFENKLEQLEVVYQQWGSGIQDFCQTFCVAQGLIRHFSNRRT